MEAELEIAEHGERLLNQMKTGEERLNDHKNFLAQWEAVKRFGLRGEYSANNPNQSKLYGQLTRWC